MNEAQATILRFPAHRTRKPSGRDDNVLALLLEAAAMFRDRYRPQHAQRRMAEVIPHPCPAKGWALRRARDCRWRAKMAQEAAQ